MAMSGDELNTGPPGPDGVVTADTKPGPGAFHGGLGERFLEGKRAGLAQAAEEIARLDESVDAALHERLTAAGLVIVERLEARLSNTVAREVANQVARLLAFNPKKRKRMAPKKVDTKPGKSAGKTPAKTKGKTKPAASRKPGRKARASAGTEAA